MGPVPVSVIRDLLPEAWVELVFTRGVDVANLTTIGRHRSSAQNAALLFASPTCGITRCEAAHGLEAHHFVTDYADEQVNRLGELLMLCRFHHDLVTHRGFSIVGAPGHWELRGPPDGPG